MYVSLWVTAHLSLATRGHHQPEPVCKQSVLIHTLASVSRDPRLCWSVQRLKRRLNQGLGGYTQMASVDLVPDKQHHTFPTPTEFLFFDEKGIEITGTESISANSIAVVWT